MSHIFSCNSAWILLNFVHKLIHHGLKSIWLWSFWIPLWITWRTRSLGCCWEDQREARAALYRSSSRLQYGCTTVQWCCPCSPLFCPRFSVAFVHLLSASSHVCWNRREALTVEKGVKKMEKRKNEMSLPSGGAASRMLISSCIHPFFSFFCPLFTSLSSFFLEKKYKKLIHNAKNAAFIVQNVEILNGLIFWTKRTSR